MTPPRVILLPGMGADGRTYQHLAVAGIELLRPDHVPPNVGETLPEYARRVAAAHAIGAEDFIGGSSFGGMVASEIAAAVPVRGLVLIGSAPAPRHLPPGVKWLERATRLAPDWLVRVKDQRQLIIWRFGPMSREQRDLLIAMSRACGVLTQRRFARMIATWDPVATPHCPTLIVHGARDRVIPLGSIAADVIIPDAGHAPELTHPAETSRAIAEFVQRHRPGSPA